MYKAKHIAIFVLFYCLLSSVFSQTTTIKGFLTEKGSGDPVQYAHFVLKGTNIGGATDTAGYFFIEVASNLIVVDTILFSSLGYTTARIAIKKNQQQTLAVEISPSFFQLDEFEIRPGENPSWAVMRKVVANKDINNPEKLKSFSSKEYSKVRFDLNHFTDKIKKNILLRPFDYIWDNTKTTDDGVQYLPILIVEKSINHYYQTKPKDKRDVIVAKKQTGLAGKNLLKFVEDLTLSPNIYNDYVVILGKNFPSPLNDHYKTNYYFFLTDSTSESGNKEYKIVFRPKHKKELGFTGEMLIDSGSYAIKQISLRFDISANVNFVRSYYIQQHYEKVDGEHWMMSTSNVLGDFTVIENVSDLTGFFGRKTSTYINYKINEEIEKSVFSGIEEVTYAEDYKDKDAAFWEETRLTEYSEEDKVVVEMVEKIEKDPAFILRKNMAMLILTGYVPVKGIDMGNIYTFYSYNEIEKSRFKLGFRLKASETNPFHFSIYSAYGTFDEQWKYGLAAYINVGKNKKNQQRFGGAYKYDIEQLGRSFNNIPLDHIITSFINIGGNSSKNYVRNFNVYFNKNITTGISTRINYFNNQISPTNNNYFYKSTVDSNTVLKNDLYTSSGVDLTFKLSYLNKNIEGNYYDKSDAAFTFKKYPDVGINFLYADKKNFKSDFDYQKIKLSLRQQVRAKKIGYFTYYLEAGKTFGTVPYTYLDVPFGNQQILYDDYAFNLMGFLEYVSDQYITAHLTHHFDGLILDRVPLINKLKWRSFIFGKGYFSSITAQNNNANYLFPDGVQALNEPYYEVGFGLENIFKIAKMDFVWRLTDNPTKDTYYFIVKPSFVFSF